MGKNTMKPVYSVLQRLFCLGVFNLLLYPLF